MPMYPQTTYWCRAVSQALGQSKTKGSPQFSLRFLVLGKVDPSNPKGELLSCDQEERTMYMSFANEKAAEITVEQLKALGFNRASFRLLDPNVEGFHDFTGVEFEGYCKHDTYQGKPKEQWSVSRGTPEVKPLAPEDTRKLDAMFGKMIKNGSTAPARAPATKPLDDPNTSLQEAAAEAGEDDIPF